MIQEPLCLGFPRFIVLKALVKVVCPWRDSFGTKSLGRRSLTTAQMEIVSSSLTKLIYLCLAIKMKGGALMFILAIVLGKRYEHNSSEFNTSIFLRHRN